jgi:DNA-binding LacI/PurR family transcriptional regulator
MQSNQINSNQQARSTLKDISSRIGLAPGTISAVLNHTRAADRIPQTTKDRIFTAARELNYQPNPLARALRTGHPLPSENYEAAAIRGALVIMDANHFTLAMNAIQQAGLRIPGDVSIVEFDTIHSAAG